MHFPRTRLAAVWVILAPLIGATPAQPPAAHSPAPPTAPKPAASHEVDRASKKTLDDAIDRLKQAGWVDMTLWEQVDLQGLTMQAEGTYLLGPDYRLHVNLKVAVAGISGKVELVCDGTTFWETSQVGSGERMVAKVQFKKVLAALNAPSSNPEVRTEFFQSQSFAGLLPLLQSIRQRMTFTRRQDHVRWDGHDTTELTGVWSEEAARTAPPPDAQPFSPYPRECRLYLDSQTLWPLRIEWWGPPAAQAANVLILQMEFRNHRPRPEGPAAQFTFDPGPGEVKDLTQQDLDLIASRERQGKGAPSGPR